MQDKTFIYGLKESGGKIRYIGKSDNPKKRFKDHIKNYKKEKNHKASWIKHCLNNNVEIELIIIEEVYKNNWQERERYWISNLDGLTNTTKGGEGFSLKRRIASYEEALDWVNNSGLIIKSRSQWIKLYKENIIPKFLPSEPSRTYHNKGWKSWSDFLNTDYKCNILKHKEYVKIETASKLAKKLNIKSSREWISWHNKTKPKNIPKFPHVSYSDWSGWQNFLGIQRTIGSVSNFLSYEELIEWLFDKNLSFKSRNEWRLFSKYHRPPTIPSNPNLVYNGFGWKKFFKDIQNFNKFK